MDREKIVTDQIAAALNIEIPQEESPAPEPERQQEIVVSEPAQIVPATTPLSEEDRIGHCYGADIDRVRRKMIAHIESMEKAMKALVGMCEMAESPEYFSALARLSKSHGEAIKALALLHGTNKEYLDAGGSKEKIPQNTTINSEQTVVFNGTTQELRKAMKQAKDE